MSIRSRRLLLIVLTGTFFGQTWLVYVDAAGRRQPPLSAQAILGQDVWYRNNCQACHQLYGFGGFLGPDLTNLARRMQDPGLAAEANHAAFTLRLACVLATGSERMPAFELTAREHDGLAAFFEELNRTGTGQVRIPLAVAPRALFERLLNATGALDGERQGQVRRGLEVAVERGCIDCHLPNGLSSFRATDLTRIRSSVESKRLAEILTVGSPEKGMPAFGLDPRDVEAVSAFLDLLAHHGPEIRQGFAASEQSSSGSLLELPWFEYP